MLLHRLIFGLSSSQSALRILPRTFLTAECFLCTKRVRWLLKNSLFSNECFSVQKKSSLQKDSDVRQKFCTNFPCTQLHLQHTKRQISLESPKRNFCSTFLRAHQIHFFTSQSERDIAHKNSRENILPKWDQLFWHNTYKPDVRSGQYVAVIFLSDQIRCCKLPSSLVPGALYLHADTGSTLQASWCSQLKQSTLFG